MTNLTTIKIPNDSIIKDFKEHIDLDFNQRILFTAPFGAGKSTFINDFQEEYKDGYRFIKLYPVNYAVSANEDIFELIKFDVLYELMAHYQAEIKLQKQDFDVWLRMSMFMQNKADLMPLLLFVLSQHEKIGKSVAVFIGALEKILKPLNKGFKEYSDQIKIDELADISTFLESFKNKKGNQYEMDATSQFICDLVDRLKGDILPNQEDVEEENQKRKNKTVLVIDDLDRLDPDHIFRLFNIFSAHTHSITGDNKFGFDKVVFVCDIENIRKIYAHKYGFGVDFSGYMDKFYSVKPFEFDHKEHLSNRIKTLIGCWDIECGKYAQCFEGDWFANTLTAVIKVLLDYKMINLRSLQNYKRLNFESIYETKGEHFKGQTVRGVLILNVVSDLLGGVEILKENILKIKGGKQLKSNRIFGYHNYPFNVTDMEYTLFVENLMPLIFNFFYNDDFQCNDRVFSDAEYETTLNLLASPDFKGECRQLKISYVSEYGVPSNEKLKILVLELDVLLVLAVEKLISKGEL